MTQNEADIPAPAADAMSAAERHAAVALAGIFSLRMLGLFMILPVFTLHASRYSGYTPTRAGIAIGIYGLSQALCQIPFGMLSDRIGRKPAIVGGLLIFALGSVLAAMADSMTGVIVGRTLQGAGAVGSAVLALTADLTREEHRTKAMAVIGTSIGLAFGIGILAGPVITSHLGLPGVFWATAVLGLLGIAVLTLYVPSPVRSRFHRDAEAVPAQFARILGDRQLLRLDGGIFMLHLILMASFFVLPLVLRDYGGFAPGRHWELYLPVLVVSVAVMVPFIIYAEKRHRLKQVFAGAVLALALTLAALAGLHRSLPVIALLMVAFFAAFNILEASLPSLVSRFAPADKKGTALGVYSTSQFFGAFLGGLSGGWIYGHYGPGAVFAFCAALAALWFVFALTMQDPRGLSSRLLKVGRLSEAEAGELAARLLAVEGVREAVVVVEDGLAYLKVDPEHLDQQALRAFSAARA